MNDIGSLTIYDLIRYAGYWTLSFTILNNLLLPREFFDEWPSFQRKYNVFLRIVNYYGALNLRQKTVEAYGRAFDVKLVTGPGAIKQTINKQEVKAEGFVQGVEAAQEAVSEIPKPPTKDK